MSSHYVFLLKNDCGSIVSKLGVDTRDMFGRTQPASDKITDLADAREEVKKFVGKFDSVSIARIYEEYDLCAKLIK